MTSNFDKLPAEFSINIHDGIIMYESPALNGFELTLLVNGRACRARFIDGQAWIRTGQPLGTNYTIRPLRLAKFVN